MLFGAILTVGGVAGAGAAIYDVSTGRATVGEVFKDIGIFIEGWIVELIFRLYDAELENTHAYALFILLLPGLLLLWFNPGPTVEPRQRISGPPGPPDGPPAVVLPQYRVFSREYGSRLDSTVSAEFFRRLLSGRGFEVEAPASGSSFTARRK